MARKKIATKSKAPAYKLRVQKATINSEKKLSKTVNKLRDMLQRMPNEPRPVHPPIPTPPWPFPWPKPRPPKPRPTPGIPIPWELSQLLGTLDTELAKRGGGIGGIVANRALIAILRENLYAMATNKPADINKHLSEAIEFLQTSESVKRYKK